MHICYSNCFSVSLVLLIQGLLIESGMIMVQDVSNGAQHDVCTCFRPRYYLVRNGAMYQAPQRRVDLISLAGTNADYGNYNQFPRGPNTQITGL